MRKETEGSSMADLWENQSTYVAEIIGILQSDSSAETKRDRLDEYHEHELSEAFLAMTRDDRRKFSHLFPAPFLAEIFAEFDPETAVPLLREMGGGEAGRILNEMENDDLVDILQAFETREERITFLAPIRVEKRNAIKTLIDYDEDVVGSIMNTAFVALEVGLTVKIAIRRLVEAAPQTEFINNIYFLQDRKLVGVLSLRELISAGNQPDRLVDDLMTVNLITVLPTTPKAEAIRVMRDYDFFLLPVVDDEDRLLGLVSFDDMAEAIDEESEADYAQLAAISDVRSEDNDNVFRTVRKRLPWLTILLFLDVFTSSIVAGFEEVLQALPVLALFMPLILNMAGNTGTQSLGVTIGLFARDQLSGRKESARHLGRELLTGLINGLAIGGLLFAGVIALKSVQGSGFGESVRFAAVIALSLTVALVASTFFGAAVPLFFRLLHIDPAVASGPFITTIVDILALLIYFALAIWMLGAWI